MKPQQVEYWVSFGSGEVLQLRPIRGDGFLVDEPSECVWIIPYENPWLMDWD